MGNDFGARSRVRHTKAMQDDIAHTVAVRSIKGPVRADHSARETPAPTETSAPKHSTSNDVPVSQSVSGDESVPVVPENGRRFLFGYITSVLSGLSLLFTTGVLGAILFDYLLRQKSGDDSSSLSLYFDVAPVYLYLVASTLVFATLYFLTTQYVARKASLDLVSLRDWRVYKIIYALFAAILLTIAATVIASLLYIPLAQLFIVEDIGPRDLTIQVFTGLHILAWVVLLLWQQHLVRHGHNAWAHGLTAFGLAIVVAVLIVIFPVYGQQDQRHDRRAESDLSRIQSKIEQHKNKHSSILPSKLTDLEFDDNDTIKQRLSSYRYEPNLAASSERADTADLKDLEAYIAAASARQRATYRLCAAFKTDTTARTEVVPLIGSQNYTTSQSFTRHQAGEVCFDR